MKKNTRDNEYAYRPLTNRPIVRTRTLSSQRLSRMPRPHKRFGHASYRRMKRNLSNMIIHIYVKRFIMAILSINMTILKFILIMSGMGINYVAIIMAENINRKFDTLGFVVVENLRRYTK